MRIHTYAAGNGGAQTRETEPQTRLREIVDVEAEEHAYRVGDEVELDIDLTVTELFGAEPGHVVVHKCHVIAVTVSYGGVEKVIEAHPATHLRKVRAKAIDAFNIPPGDAADLVLRLPEAEQDLNLAEPVGAVVPLHSCAVTVDLVHTVRPQG
ncbi:ribosomal protein L21E [Catenulispora sp. GAS73]|uniref:hypothetical protein n=1 Tax=Catenulispora sp. GAS73 TaxID=3156269 RepID=UPI00351310EF